MKIVGPDGFTLNPGDLGWDRLAELGELDVYERTPPDQSKTLIAAANCTITPYIAWATF